MSKETLGIVLAVVVGVMGFAIWVADKYEKATSTLIVMVLLVMALLCLCGVYLIPWLWNGGTIAERIWRPTSATALVLIVVGYFGVWVSRPHKVVQGAASDTPSPQPPLAQEREPTLRDLFQRDIPNTMKLTQSSNVHWHSSGKDSPFERQLYLDYAARAKFVGFYLPSSKMTYELSLILPNYVQETMEELQSSVKTSAGYRGEQNTEEELVFSGRVLLYHEDFLSIKQKASIIDAFTSKYCDVQFRGPDYLGDQVMAWRQQHRQP